MKLALRVLIPLALAKLALHLLTAGPFGYGYFIDELYYLDCARHLDWGYVDLPPLLPALTWVLAATVGESLLAVRLIPALAGAALVILAGALAREIGGGRWAQGLAGLAVVTAPVWLVLHSFHSMNAFEPLLWTGCALVLVRILGGGDRRLWLLYGALSGLGLLNKHSMAFFGIAALGGLLLTRERRAFSEPWIWLGGLVCLALFAPNLAWVVAHGFPHFEALANIRFDQRDVALSPIAFLGQQVLYLHPLSLPLWLGGLVDLLWGRQTRFRALGWAFVVLMGEMLVLHGRPYYPAPFYPILLAAGGVAAERCSTRPLWRWAVRILVALLTASAVVLAPLFLPCLPPETFVRYTQRLGFDQPRIENHRLGPLPQLFADRFGWPEMAETVAAVYRGLRAAEREEAAIFAQSYGQAGAINLFGPRLGLPPAISGHLSHHLWGFRGHTGRVVIVLDDRREVLEQLFEEVAPAGRVHHPYAMPSESFDVFVCRRSRVPLRELWPQLKQYD